MVLVHESGVLETGPISIKRGIFQGDSLHDPGSRNCAVFVLYTVSIVPSFTHRV